MLDGKRRSERARYKMGLANVRIGHAGHLFETTDEAFASWLIGKCIDGRYETVAEYVTDMMVEQYHEEVFGQKDSADV